MFDARSLANQNALGGIPLEASTDVGWRTVLLERRRWQAGSYEAEGLPSSDLRLSISQGQLHVLELKQRDRWTSFDIEAGAMSITAPEEVDRLRWIAQVPTQTISLYIPGPIIEAALEAVRKPGTAITTQHWELKFSDPIVLATISALIEGMRLGAPDIYAEQAATWLAMRLVLSHNGVLSNRAASKPVLKDGRVLRVVELIRSRLSEPLTLDDLAGEACVSKFHFARLFREKTGLTPYAFVLTERLRLARDKLRETDDAVATIARNVGYTQSTAFGLAFKKAHGITPRQYRQRWRERHSSTAPKRLPDLTGETS